MSSHGVRPAFLPVVIATEILGALAIVLGWKTRLAAFLLAGHALLTAVIFHRHFDDQIELVLLLTDVSIAGGLLLLAANGSGPLSLDHRGTNVRTLGARRDQCGGYRADRYHRPIEPSQRFWRNRHCGHAKRSYHEILCFACDNWGFLLHDATCCAR